MASSSSPIEGGRAHFQPPAPDDSAPSTKAVPQDGRSSLSSAKEENSRTTGGFCALCLWIFSPFIRVFRWISDRICGSSNREIPSPSPLVEVPSTELVPETSSPTQPWGPNYPLIQISSPRPTLHFFRDIVSNCQYTREAPFKGIVNGKEVAIWVTEASSTRSIEIQSREFWELGPDSEEADCEKWEILYDSAQGVVTYRYENEVPLSKYPKEAPGKAFGQRDGFYINTAFHLLQVDYYRRVLGFSPIAKNFTSKASYEEQLEAHQSAKQFLTEKLLEIGGEFECIAPRPKRDSDTELLQEESLPLQIEASLVDSEVFTWEATQGVFQDIQAAGKLSDEKDESIYVFSVASQFNGTEAVQPETPVPGSAEVTYVFDRTQGPQAQLAFLSEVIEAILCAANLGFSSIIPVLSQETRGEVSHGYLMPHAEKGTLLLQQLIEKGHLIEYPCIGSLPKRGEKNVYEILVSAPATGYCDLIRQGVFRDKIEYLCALHAFRAQFAQSIALAQRHSRPVKLKLAGIGLGAFCNCPENIAKALFQATQEYQEELKTHGVRCQFQIYKGIDPNAQTVAALLGLQKFRTV